MLPAQKYLALFVEMQSIGLETNVFHIFVRQSGDFETTAEGAFDRQGLAGVSPNTAWLAADMHVLHVDTQSDELDSYQQFKFGHEIIMT